MKAGSSCSKLGKPDDLVWQTGLSGFVGIVVLWLQLQLSLCPLATTENSWSAAQPQQQKAQAIGRFNSL
jgi:hypothetical protein